MKVFVTGVGGQLGHDIMSELLKRGYEGIGSDIAPVYSGVADKSTAAVIPYISLDITDKGAVEKSYSRSESRCCDSLRCLDCSGYGRR
jgi:dTDP-4-dehydrorhamnose reductase (EC 1.1.1.133)